MKNCKTRYRERRTKPAPAGATRIVKVHATQEEYDQFKKLEHNQRCSKEEIFRRGLQACMSR